MNTPGTVTLCRPDNSERPGDVGPGCGWRARSDAELLHDQVCGIDAWARHRAVGSAAAEGRDIGVELRRHADSRRVERQALLERAREHLGRRTEAVVAEGCPRAVLAHRNDWFRAKVAHRLVERGLQVLLSTADGAYAAGAIVVEQPDILLVEDHLPTLTGLEVLDRAKAFSPATLTAVQLVDTEQLERYHQQGARALFTRRIPPAEVADLTLDCLLHDHDEVLT